MAKEVIKIFKTDDPSGLVSIEAEVAGNRYFVRSYPTQAEFLASGQEWANSHVEAAALLAVACYLAVDPTGVEPGLLTDVQLEIDPSALTIVRRTAAL